MKNLRDSCNEESLGKAGDSGNDGVSAGQQGHHDLIDDFVLTDNDFADFGIDLLQFDMKPLDDFEFLFLFNAQFHSYLTSLFLIRVPAPAQKKARSRDISKYSCARSLCHRLRNWLPRG